jgi:hypothetical protein
VTGWRRVPEPPARMMPFMLGGVSGASKRKKGKRWGVKERIR